jgi:hypothetical protein
MTKYIEYHTSDLEDAILSALHMDAPAIDRVKISRAGKSLKRISEGYEGFLSDK